MTHTGRRYSGSGEGMFSFRVTKDSRVFISCRGRQVTVLAGRDARRFLDKIQHLPDKEADIVMAKATGNFKRIPGH